MITKLFARRLALSALLTMPVALTALVAPVAAFASTAASPDHPYIEVTGNGQASAPADLARAHLAVVSTATMANTAMTDDASATRRMEDALTAAGVAQEDIHTTGLTLFPQYDQDKPTTVTGYRVTQYVDGVLRDLKTAGTQLDAAVAAGQGATQVESVDFELSDNNALLVAARKDAVADARAKATQYAELTQTRLGQVQQISEENSTPLAPPSPVSPGAIGSSPGMPTPISPDVIQARITVHIIWSLEPEPAAALPPTVASH